MIADRFFFHTSKLNSEESQYCAEILGQVTMIKENLLTLQMIRIMIAELHPNSGITQDSKIADEFWLKYHIENFFLRITTYQDQIGQLLALVFKWKIKQSSRFILLLKEKAKNEGVSLVLEILDDLSVLLKSAKKIRNKLAHSGTLSNVDISLVTLHKEIDDFISSIPFLKENHHKYLEPDLNKLFLNEVMNKNLKEIMQIETDLATNLFKVLDALYPKYIEMIPEDHSSLLKSEA